MRQKTQSSEFRAMRSRDQKELLRKKKIVINSCINIIQTNNLTNINLPDGRSGIKKFQNLENSLLNLF